MLARSQRYRLFCLPSSKMEMVGIAGNRLIERRRVGIDDKMVVPSIRLVHSRWRNAHIFEAKANGGLGADNIPIMRRYEVNPRPGWRWRRNLLGVRLLMDGVVFNKDMYDLRHHGWIEWNMSVIAEKQLQCMIAGAQKKFGLRLSASVMHMIEVARDLLIQGRQGGVNEKVMVAAIAPQICCWGYVYSARAKPYDRFGRDFAPSSKPKKKTLAPGGAVVRSIC